MARIRKIILILSSVSALMLSALTLCSLAANKTATPVTETKEIRGIILPHHLIVEKNIDTFYKTVSENRKTLKKDTKRIILLSPNHFNYGFSYIQSTTQKFTPKNSPEIDTDFIKILDKNTQLSIEPKDFEKEHGIMAELSFIKKHFPEAKIAPIIFKSDIPEERLTQLIKEISKQDLSNTLIIASIDFTHYETEEIAVKNDKRITDWLKTWSSKSPKNLFKEIHQLADSISGNTKTATAIDSPESFYTLIKLMEDQASKEVSVWKRTSSASLLNIKDPLQNTSHLFVTFSK